MDLKISDKASQLAKEWMKSMKGGENSDSEEADNLELKADGRPTRLGLGAEHVPQSSLLTTTIHPVEKKLRAKLNVLKGTPPASFKPGQASRATDKYKSGKSANEEKDDDDDAAGRGSLFCRKQKTNSFDADLLGLGKGSKKRQKS